MATEADWICPVCHDTRKDIACVTPCLHKFCFGCIMRWATTKPNCPLCKRVIVSIQYSMWSDVDFLEVVVTRPAEPAVDSQQDAQGAAGPVPRTSVGGLQPQIWAGLFRDFPEMLDLLRPWLRQQAREMHRAAWWDVAVLEANVIARLCRYGLDEETLVRELQPFLQSQTATFVQQLLRVAAEQYNDEFLDQLELMDSPVASEQENSHEMGLEGSQNAREQEDSPVTLPSPAASIRGIPVPSLLSSGSPAGRDAEELPSTSRAALRGGPSHPTATRCREQEQPHAGLGQAAAEGPMAQGCSHRASAPGQGRDRSPGGPRHPRKRRASSSQDSPPPCKKPPPQRH
ncbi:TOPRS ligase, partial [Anseranas semipalmata]|nr:TOPRS ligase [Anseranas semipalmata]